MTAWRPPTSERGRDLAATVSALARQLSASKEEHDHRHGAEGCPVCGAKVDRRSTS